MATPGAMFHPHPKLWSRIVFPSTQPSLPFVKATEENSFPSLLPLQNSLPCLTAVRRFQNRGYFSQPPSQC